MDNSGWNMYVFRGGRKTVAGESVRARVVDALRRYEESRSDDACLAALIAAGELECALSDAGSEHAGAAAAVTDALAGALVQRCVPSFARLRDSLASLRVPLQVRFSVAEGFAYYALHPRKFVHLISGFSLPRAARVIGLRSIGTTLGATIGAVLRMHGVSVERTSVRPHGHPYNRQLSFSEPEREWLLGAPGAQVFIVDEGPGISGSSFLCVAEEVERAGIPRENIVIIGSREPLVSQLRAESAPERWKRFRFHSVAPEPLLPPGAEIDVGGGAWRQSIATGIETHPASWTQLESAKYTNVDRSRAYKFFGYGHYGETLAERANVLAAAEFAPPLLSFEMGFGVSEWVAGSLLLASQLSREIAQRLAGYCAFRAGAFPADGDSEELARMVRWNWECEFGRPLDPAISLATTKSVIADARMMPHEWLRTSDGQILKLDAVSHGDDHFFPGPCDIAWDLAGAIIEWQMSEEARSYFLAQYRLLSGDDPRERLPGFLLAYAVFRMAWSKMAAQASGGSPDEGLLLRDYLRYRARAEELARVNASETNRAPVLTRTA